MSYTVSFIRHGEHSGECVVPGLTARGVAEARMIGNALAINSLNSHVAFVADGSRFVGTAVLAMLPSLGVDRVEATASRLIDEGRVILDSDLAYRFMPDGQFKTRMLAAFSSGRAMGFLVSESDMYVSDDELSTYRTMSRLIARKVLSAAGDTILCAKELMAPSLRARVTSMRHGQDALNDYVEWYMDKEEWNPEARTHPITIETDGNEYLLKDVFGEVDFDRSVLTSIGENGSE